MSGNSLLSLYMFIIFLSQYLKTGFAFSTRSEVDVNIKCIERERQALLKIKQDLIDEYGHLSSWGNEEHKKDCCNWRGVSCSNRTGHVISLNLHVTSSYKFFGIYKPLKGKISASLLELQYLNYLGLGSNNFGGQQIPEFIGSLSKLRYLDLSRANFSGRVPYQLGNLSRLQSLDLSDNDGTYSAKLEWLSCLSSLRMLALNYVNLSEATDWLQVISRLPSLTKLLSEWCNLPSVNPSSISFINSSTSLAFLDLSSNNLSNSVYLWLSHYSSSLAHLDLGNNSLQGSIRDDFCNLTSLTNLVLSGNLIDGIPRCFSNLLGLKTLWLDDNNLQGSIPDAFCNMTSLTYLYLSANLINGIPSCFRNLCGLKELRLDNNNISGQLSVLFNFSVCFRDNLELLDLGKNSLSGPLPDFTGFLSMEVLSLDNNRLNGTIPESIGQLSKLEILHAFSNSLEGMITEVHLSNLSKLITLSLSSNSLTLNFSNRWVPPFRLQYIGLQGCKLGPYFPKWLQTQNTISYLDISNAGIVGTLPNWFWDLSTLLVYLNLSHNGISGILPDLSTKFISYPAIDLSSNYFEGLIPSMPSNVKSLILSNNMFSGPISFMCQNRWKQLVYMDLSNNQLSGEVFDCFKDWQKLEVLNLANNNFSGKILSKMGSDCRIWAFDLHNNSFIGELPSSLRNCNKLTILDVGNNIFSGEIPTWMGHSLPNLFVLGLRSNQFHGNIPIEICDLRIVQILDFSNNNISGYLPKCLDNLTAMVQKESSNATIERSLMRYIQMGTNFSGSYQGNIFLVWKGIYSQYKSTMGLVKSIDFSSNKLSGNIPKEITNLVGLISLNLSRNSLIGSIPTEIGKLNLLNSLDLSMNQLTGEIPESFSHLDALGVLNLSNNNLSGEIPSSTKPQSFSASSYMGNPNLCGSPLPNKCSEDEAPHHPVNTVSENEDGLITRGFYISMVFGLIIGFWGVCGTLVLKKSWRYAYFRFLSNKTDKLYILIAVNVAKLQRKLRR